jgi:hypothetical protein
LERHLRGNEEVHEDRELASASVQSSSLAFSVASSRLVSHGCFDFNRKCKEQIEAFTESDAEAEAWTSASAYATASTEQNLWLESTCTAMASRFAEACAFTNVKGKVRVSTSVQNGKKTVEMTLQLSSASTTYAMAKTKAAAETYANVEDSSFTSLEVYCADIKNMSPLCPNSPAKSELKQVGVARAKAMGQAKGLSTSRAGSTSQSNAAIMAIGSSLDSVNAVITGYANTWAFSNAGATAAAFADTFSKIESSSFTNICIEQYGKICANTNEGVCGESAGDACAKAWANGQAQVLALASGCATAFVQAEAATEASFGVEANVDCVATPKLTKALAPALAEVVCPATELKE